MTMYLVTVRRDGPEWDPDRSTREQSGWDVHAAFMDSLVEQGFVVLGGPLDDVRVALAIEAGAEDDLRATLADDPWSGSHLSIESIEPWTIWLDSRRPTAAD